MKPFLIFLVSALFGAANSIAWHLIGFTDGTSGGAGGAAAAILFFGLYRKYGKKNEQQ
jgi:hypothetical protein